MLTDDVSLAGFGSVCVSPDLRRGVADDAGRGQPDGDVQCRSRRRLPASRPSRFPVAGSYAPCDALELTNTRPLGSTSVTVTPVAASGPLSCAVIV